MIFGVNLLSGDERLDIGTAARRAEAAGFDVVTVADHFGAPAPFTVLAAAAAVTHRVRLRTYVLDVGFWQPGLLAREVATLDALSGGRVDLGIGAGHMRSEHEDLGLPFLPFGRRWAEVERCIGELRRRLAGPGFAPRPMQDPVPVQVAAMGPKGLGVAARLADIIGLAGVLQVHGEPPGTFTLASPEQTAERMTLVRAIAGDRTPVLDALLQRVVVDRDPEHAVAELAAEVEATGRGPLDTDLWLRSPFALFAPTPAAGAEELIRRGQSYGISSWCTHARSGPGLAAVRAALC